MKLIRIGLSSRVATSTSGQSHLNYPVATSYEATLALSCNF